MSTHTLINIYWIDVAILIVTMMLDLVTISIPNSKIGRIANRIYMVGVPLAVLIVIIVLIR